jgi:hypothetical protein
MQIVCHPYQNITLPSIQPSSNLPPFGSSTRTAHLSARLERYALRVNTKASPLITEYVGDRIEVNHHSGNRTVI